MTLEFTVGINIAGERRTMTVSAEDALIAALKVKQRQPQATINEALADVYFPHNGIISLVVRPAEEKRSRRR